MRRARHPWDRFYRYHEAPWRGEREVAPLLPLLGSGPVLELGCGNGKLLRPLARHAQVVGLDIAWHALRRLDHDRRVLADAAVLPFQDAAFSCALDIHCAGHLGPDGRRAAAREAHRTLRPGGALVVERLGRDDLRAAQGRPVPGDPHARAVVDGRTTWFADEAALRRLFEGAGFTTERVWSTGHPVRLRGVPARRVSVHGVFRRPA